MLNQHLSPTTISITLIFITSITYAKPLTHSHGGRTHSHPLPTQGVEHRHGNGAYGVISTAAKNTQDVNTKIQQNNTGNNDHNKNIIAGVCKPYNKKFSKRDAELFAPMPAALIKYNYNNVDNRKEHFYPNGDFYVNTKKLVKKGKWNTAQGNLCTWIDGKLYWNLNLAYKPKEGKKSLRYYIRDNGDVGVYVTLRFQKDDHTLRNKYVAQAGFRQNLQVSNTGNIWKPINKKDAYKLISGKTLISEHKVFCAKGDTSSSCKKIAILSPSNNMAAGGKNPATIILPSEEEIIKSHWGLYATDWLYLDLNMGIIPVPVNNNKFSFESVVSVNKSRDALRIITPDKKMLEINIVKGKNNYYLAQAKKGNYNEFDNTGRKTTGQAIAGSIIKGIGNSMKSSGNSSNVYSPSNNNTSNNIQKSTTSKAHVTGIKERKPWTIVKCSKGKDTKIHHNSDRSCTDDYSFGSYPCPHVIKKAVKRCENR